MSQTFEKMKTILLNHHEESLMADFCKKFRFKVHNQRGAGFHTDFKFLVKADVTGRIEKTISLEIKKNVNYVRGLGNYEMSDEGFEALLKVPFWKGIIRFKNYLDEIKKTLSNNLKIEIFEYVVHPVDSSAMGNEYGLEWALKCVFESQLEFEKDKRFIFEMLD